MGIKKITKKFDFFPKREEVSYLKKETKIFSELLKKEIARKGLNAEVFVGGSFAKGTLVKSYEYEIDIFARFDWKYEDLSDILEEILKEVCKKNKKILKRLHGSRDYFVVGWDKRLVFEVVPVIKIRNVREARNVTDLSYFHVDYVKRNLKGEMRKELLLTKEFCKGQRVYGAESYIKGFSGYALECLIIYYKTFEKMLKALVKVKENEQLIIDPMKHFKKKDSAFFWLNESKLQSPIILVDPTWKERNVLAALSLETFKKFQETAKKFLKKPSEKFFYLEKLGENKLKEKAKEKKAEFLHIILKTERQEGDIAGTKMKKFADFLLAEMKKYFDVLYKEFNYEGKKEAHFYLLLKKKKEIIRIGPPLERAEDAKKFKEKNKNVFEKNGILHARIKIDFLGKEFLKKFIKEEKNRKIKEMGISDMKILE